MYICIYVYMYINITHTCIYIYKYRFGWRLASPFWMLFGSLHPCHVCPRSRSMATLWTSRLPGTSQALRENRTWGQNDVVQSDIFRDVSLGKTSHWFCRCSDEGKLLQCYVRWSNSVPGSNVDSSLNFSASTPSQAHHNCNQVEALMHIKNHCFGVHHSG